MTEISLLSYGIYLIHVLVLSSWREGRFGLTIAHDSFLSHPIDPWIGVPLHVSASLGASAAIIALMRRAPVLRHLAA